MTIKWWSDKDIAQLRLYKLAGKPNDEIAALFGRTAKAIRAKVDHLNLTPDKRQYRYQKDAERRLSRIGGVASRPMMPQAPPEVFEDRSHRYTIQPRDLTAAFCGDPLPGYSALERRA